MGLSNQLITEPGDYHGIRTAMRTATGCSSLRPRRDMIYIFNGKS